MLRGGTVNEIHELNRQRLKIREISRRLGVARNTVRKYLRAPGVPRARSPLFSPRAQEAEPHRFLAPRVENLLHPLRLPVSISTSFLVADRPEGVLSDDDYGVTFTRWMTGGPG